MLVRLLIILTTLILGSSLAMAQERVWNLDHTDQEAYLVFGVPETDDVGVSFWCTLKSGIVRLYVPDTDPNLKLATNMNFDLEIETKIYPLKGKTAVNEESAGTSLEAELKASDPLFSALREANHFAVKVGASNHVFPLSEADFLDFLEDCRKP
jgi:hypothetical protein